MWGGNEQNSDANKNGELNSITTKQSQRQESYTKVAVIPPTDNMPNNSTDRYLLLARYVFI